jgi:hypothetical protein
MTYSSGVFGCGEKIKREKYVRERVREERNRVDKRKREVSLFF